MISKVTGNRKSLAAALVLIAAMLAGCGSGASDSADGATASAKAQQLRTAEKTAVAASAYDRVVQQLYVSYFGRPADAGGLVNFEGALAAANAPTDIQALVQAYGTNTAIKSLVDSFGSSAESNALYGSGATAQFVTAIFRNVLGRPPAQQGLAFWTDAIDKGTLTRGDAALSIMAGALKNTTAQGLLDAQLINNRLALADQFTAALSTASYGDTYVGSAAAASARAMLAEAGATTSASTYGAIVDGTLRALRGNSATYNTPSGVAVDAAGNIYVCYTLNDTIRKIDLYGTVTTLAGSARVVGSANGVGAAANFSYPNDLVADAAGNVYVADNDTIRKITPDGVVTTLAGSPGTIGYADGFGSSAIFNGLFGLAIDAAGNIYTTESGNNIIRKVSPQGMVTTVAGVVGVAGSADGVAGLATFYSPAGIAVDAAGNLFVADTGNSIIRKISVDGVVSTLAGSARVTGSIDGIGAGARFNGPLGIVVDAADNVYVADQVNATIRKISPTGAVSTIAGQAGVLGNVDGLGTSATFESPEGLAIDGAGNIYVADASGEVIRMITPNGVVSTISGSANNYGSSNGGGAAVSLKNPQGIAIDASGKLYIGDAGESVVVTMNSANVITILAGGLGVTGTDNGNGTAARFEWPDGIAVDSAGNVYVADISGNMIRKISPAGLVTTLAGAPVAGSVDGIGTAAGFRSPASVAVDSAGNVYVADFGNATVRKILPNGTVSTFAGKAGVTGVADGSGTDARFYTPQALTVDSVGNIYVADSGNANIRKITPQGVVSTIAGKPGNSPAVNGVGQAAGFFVPEGIAVDGSGNLYVSDWNTIRKITPDGTVTTLVGIAGVTGSADGTGAAASFNIIVGIAVDGSGNIFAVDQNNAVIRKITPAGVVTTLKGVAPQ